MRKYWNRFMEWCADMFGGWWKSKDFVISLSIFLGLSILFTWILGFSALGYGLAYLAVFIVAFSIQIHEDY